MEKELWGLSLSITLISCLLATEIASAVPNILYESVPATVQDIDAGGSNTFNAQTFTPSVSHTVSIISLKLYYVNAQTSGPINVEIVGTDVDGKPLYPNPPQVYASGVLDSSILTASHMWYNITMNRVITVNSGTTYAIVLIFDIAAGQAGVAFDGFLSKNPLNKTQSFLQGQTIGDATIWYFPSNPTTVDYAFKVWGPGAAPATNTGGITSAFEEFLPIVGVCLAFFFVAYFLRVVLRKRRFKREQGLQSLLL